MIGLMSYQLLRKGLLSRRLAEWNLSAMALTMTLVLAAVLLPLGNRPPF